jgi:hypothetical protein
MANCSDQVTSLAPLKACPLLRKLDLRGCLPPLHDQVEDLQLACTLDLDLADPSSVVLGLGLTLHTLVNELQPSMSPVAQCAAASMCVC